MTKTRLTTFALAATAFALLAGSASATPFKDPGHGPVIPPGFHKPVGNGGGQTDPGNGSGGKVVTCEIGTGCKERGGDRDPGYGDRDHDHDYWRDYWRHRDYGRYDWDRWHGYRLRPEVVIESAPVAVPAPVATEVAPVAQAPCNCLTKQKLADGSVLFQDICSKESAIAAPQVGAR
jgi:hypothetical protein